MEPAGLRGIGARTRRLRAFVRRLSWLPLGARADVLIVDNSHSYVQRCVPEGAAWFHLPIRGSRWYVNPGVAWRFLGYLRRRRKFRLALRGCYVAAVAGSLRARVIATFIDNNNWDTGLADCLPVRLVCIGNGWRHPDHLRGKCFDCYFSISAYPDDDSSKFEMFAREFIACGHLKMGLYLEQKDRRPVAAPGERTVLWISQFRPEANFRNSPGEHRELQRQKHHAQLTAAGHLGRYAAARGYRSRVALSAHNKGHGREFEIAYYESAGTARHQYSAPSNSEWASYDEVDRAGLVAGIYSTLLFESLGAGKRVLFFIPAAQQLLYDYVAETVPLARIRPLAVFGESYEEFARKCDEILGWSDEEYGRLIADLRRDVVCHDPQAPPQHRIRDRLRQMLSSAPGPLPAQ